MKHAPLCLSLALLLLAGACKPEPYLTVTPSSLSFSEDGGTQTVLVSANRAWTANVGGTGFSVSPSSGEGDASVTVTASPTNGPNPVTVSLVFHSEGLSSSVELHQAARSAILVGNVATIPAEGGTFEVPVQYNTDIAVEVESAAQSWIRFVQTRALTSGKLVFDVDENEKTEPRTAKVTVKDKSGKAGPVTITLVQEEKKVIEVGDVSEIAAEGGTYEVRIEYNADFSVTVEKSAQSWIRFVETKALTSGWLVFSFKANETPDARSGRVTIQDKSGKVEPVTLTFVQAEKKVIEVGEVTEIAAEGGTYEVEIAYNADYSVEVEKAAQGWITFVETRALSRGKLVFVFAENEAPDARTGNVTVRDNGGKVEPLTLTFVQAEKKVIEVGEVTEIAAEGGTYEVEIAYNTDFTVEVEKSAQSWLSFVKTRALISGRMVFMFSENRKARSRTGKVTVKDPSGKVEPVTLNFVQVGAEPYLRVICPEAAALSYEAGELTILIEHNVTYSGAYAWDGSALEMFDLDAMRRDWDSDPFLCTMIIPYRRNQTRNVLSASFAISGGDSLEFTDSLYVYQYPVKIIISELEAFVPAVPSEFSFRVAEEKPDNYRVECDADWIELVKSQGKEGGAEYRWKTEKNSGTGMREAQIKVYLDGFSEPDVFHVCQEGPELSVSVTYSGKQVKAPSIYGPHLDKSTIWWGDGTSDPYSDGATHSYGTSGRHTVTISTKTMKYVERAEVTEVKDGMHVDFSNMRKHDE